MEGPQRGTGARTTGVTCGTGGRAGTRVSGASRLTSPPCLDQGSPGSQRVLPPAALTPNPKYLWLPRRRAATAALEGGGVSTADRSAAPPGLGGVSPPCPAGPCTTFRLKLVVSLGSPEGVGRGVLTERGPRPESSLAGNQQV